MTEMTHLTHDPEGTGTNGFNSPPRPTLNPNALSLANAAALLTRAGASPVTVEMLEADLAAGAPANPEGTLNLVHYAAWLAREVARGD
jgi:hypothetical protein